MRARKEKTADARARRSRQALLDAFFKLVLTRDYEELTVQMIAARAGVGRSTFYAHFPGKNALLAASLAGPFSVLAETVRQPDNTPALTAILEHFWANRARARGTFTGTMRRHTVAVLTRLIEQRLRRDATGRLPALRLPPRLVAIQLAEVLFAPLTAWLMGESACCAAKLAQALRRSARAVIAAMGIT
jgi:AcrR family transcriptional regulator